MQEKALRPKGSDSEKVHRIFTVLANAGVNRMFERPEVSSQGEEGGVLQANPEPGAEA